MKQVYLVAEKSRDPMTKIGAVLVKDKNTRDDLSKRCDMLIKKKKSGKSNINGQVAELV